MDDNSCQRLSRTDAARRVREVHGQPCTPETLATMAWAGSGPAYRKVAGRTFYDPSDVDRWAEERISPPIRRAAEATRTKSAAEAAAR